MITVITICYIGLVLLAFKVIKIKVSPVTVAISVLLGVFILSGIMVGWQMSAPLSSQMFLRRHVLQVIPDVREFVTKNHVEENQLVKKGDPLFEIGSERFQDAVDQAAAELEAAKSTVSQLGSSVVAAEAAVKRSSAETASSKAEVDVAEAIHKASPGAIAKLTLKTAEQQYLADQADDKLQNATLKQTKFSLAAAKHSVKVAESVLNTAKFNLNRCTFTSPVDGRIMNWQVVEGVPVARWRIMSVGTIMDMSDTAIIAIYPQNKLKYVEAGNVVEIAFKRRPGQIATGKVEAVVEYTGEGQFMPSGKLPVAANVGSKGFLAVRIRLDDKKLEQELPLGAAGSVAIYTDVGGPFHVITKITVRIKAWMNYVPM